ncbi:MAG: hypothetical protein ACRYFZ_10370 [Janthinobacterium lividum]
MLPDNIDDLFRQKLDGHATPPSNELWARLHQPPAADDDAVDTLFRAGLGGHASQPRRELWERLEDEHLRPQPRRRRVVAWWQLSAAAVLLLMLLAGGGLLWRGSYLGTSGGEVARLGGSNARSQASPKAAIATTQSTTNQPKLVAQPQDLATTNAPTTASQEKSQENVGAQATASHASTSSTPIATTARPRRPATTPRASSGPQTQSPRPDAAAGSLARTGGRKTPAGQLLTTPTVTTASAVAPPTHSNDSPALATASPAPAGVPEIIEVEVRRSGTRPAPEAVVADASPAPARRRGLRLGGLLRQADHLVHGEPVSLADATGLPETVTVQARLGGRLVSKTIQL